ncbi:MAG: SCO family protein [Gammaproteobacteria bacterium]
MEDRPTTQKNVSLFGLAYIAAIPVLAFALSFIPLKTNAAINLPFLANAQTERVLAFGGFPGCGSICPLSLSTLQQTYIDYKSHITENDLSVVFLNIKLNSSPEITNQYAQSFHQEFNGYSTIPADASALYKKLSLKTFSSEQDYSAHQGLIYLFEKIDQQWRMTSVFDGNINQQDLLNYLLKKYS